MKILLAASALVFASASCSEQSETAANADREAGTADSAAAISGSDPEPPGPKIGETGQGKVPPGPDRWGTGPSKVSRVIGEEDITAKGQPTCQIDYTYAGGGIRTQLWIGEDCDAASAAMMTAEELKKYNNWDILTPAQQADVNALPDGKVLYIEGSFSASIYPRNAAGSVYEVSVSD